MRFLRFLLPVLIASIFVLTPQTTLAANASFFGPIISPECHCDAAHNNGVDSAPDWGCVLQTVQNIVNVSISLAILVSVIIIAYAGFLFMFSPLHAHSREMGRTILLNAVIGLAIALSAWLIVDFVMKTLYNENSGFGPWNTILGQGGKRCLEVKAPVTATGITNSGGVSAGGASGEGGSCSGPRHQPIQVAGNEKTIRDRLSGQGITINKLPCPSGVAYQCVNGGCTSVDGWNSATADQVVQLKALCGSIEVTGGSEQGHADGGESHGAGAKVDLASGFTSCVTNHPQYFIRDGSRGSHPRYKDYCSPANEYVDEGTHWDITVRRLCQRQS
mgnify:FL=1